MALVVDGGGLVNKGGALGTGAACCCNKCSGPCDEENPCATGCVCVDGQCVGGGACCLPERCTVELDVDFTGTEYEGGPPPTPAGWTQIGALVPEFPNVIHYIHVIPDTEPCDDQSQYYADLVAAITAWSDDLSLPIGATAFSAVAQQEASCQDGLSQSACEEQGGTYHPGQTCAEEPCCDCKATGDQEIDYCTQVDGEWQYCSLGQCVPCECGEGWTTTIREEGVFPWGEAYRVVDCSYSSDADYETCCSPDAPREDGPLGPGTGPLANCEAYNAMLASSNPNLLIEEAGVNCLPDNPLP